MMLLPLFIIGCRYDLVDEPSLDYNEHKTAADYSDFILPPSKITASHGESKAVTISWEAVENAVQYQIFAAENPFSTFSKVSETKGTETEILIEEESGITKYYCVSAVNYYGTVSSKSIVVCGSTLAVPIITAIEPSEEGNAVKLSWWMDNCSGETYENSVSYNINVYNVTNQTIKFKSLEAEGNLREVNIDGLASTTEYLFEVEVVKADSTAKECSEKTSAETAHRVIPDKPVDFAVSQGDSKDSIKLSWKLPEQVWYRENSGVSGYTLHDLKFKIYKKNANAADSEFKFIEDMEPATYTPGDEVIWEDSVSEADRGKKFAYYIQSVTADTPNKTITADSSKTDVLEGWLLTIPCFSIKTEYEKSEDGLNFTKILFGFNASFESFGKNYTYCVTREKYTLPTELNPDSEPDASGDDSWSFNSISEINAAHDIFDNPASKKGYYIYKLFICPEGVSDCSTENIDIAEAAGKYLVTDDANAFPKIESFIVADGYKDKFILSWAYHSDYKYTILWKNGENGTQESAVLDHSELVIDDSDPDNPVATYEHAADSGDRRIYTLEASLGLSTDKTILDEQDNPKIFETLGTPAPVITAYDYDKLLVEWPAVQKATAGYKISAKYEGESEELVIESAEGVDANYEIKTTGSDDEEKYTCVITKPAGYDDASISGKNIKFTVTAQNAVDTTDSTIDVCTVGPALTEIAVLPKQASIIDVRWEPVDGADGYIIRRITYKTATQHPEAIKDDEITNPDVYYYDAVNDTLTINGEAADGIRASVNLVQGAYKLTDTYKEATSNTNPYEANQSYIAWGIPFGYTVIPVKHGGSADDFTLAGRTVTFEGNTYNNLAEQFGATIGYGLNVHAKKSESADTQVLEWDAPFNASNSFTVYYRTTGSTANSWQMYDKSIDTSVFNGKQTVSFKPDSAVTAYEYLIAYDQTVLLLTNIVPDSFINDMKLGLSKDEDSTSYDYSEVPKEKANKGYLLAVNYTPATGKKVGDEEDIFDYSETVNWNAWDYNYRSIGPTTASIYIKNYNISSNWIKIASLDKDLHYSSAETVENTTIKKTNNDTSIKLAPTKKMMDDSSSMPVTKGPLMVLRDAKHYYAMELTRGDTSVLLGNNDSKYAYRNISKKELVKCALLNMVYAFYLDAGGQENLENSDKQLTFKKLDGKGYSKLNNLSWTWWLDNYTATTTMSSFSGEQLTPSNTKGSIFKTSYSETEIKLKGTENYYLVQFSNTFTVTVTNNDNLLPSCYSGEFSMTCDASNKLKVLMDNQTIIDTNDIGIRRVYFPMQIANSDKNLDDKKYWIKDPTYGFWTE